MVAAVAGGEGDQLPAFASPPPVSRTLHTPSHVQHVIESSHAPQTPRLVHLAPRPLCQLTALGRRRRRRARAREREQERDLESERERKVCMRGARHGASAIHTAGQSIWGHSKVKQKPMGVIDDHGNWIRTSVQENLGFCASTAAVVEVKSIGSPVPEFWLVDVDHNRLQHSFPSCSVLAGSSKTVRQRVDEARGTCGTCAWELSILG